MFYGLYEDHLGEETVACIITSYCGERPSVPVYGMSWDFKALLIDAVGKIHCTGVQHNDLLERNIVIDDKSRLFIIDFDYAENRECDFGCDELYAICRLAGIWMPHLCCATCRFEAVT